MDGEAVSARMKSRPNNSAAANAATDAADRRRSLRVPQRGTFSVRPLLSNGVGAPITMVLQDLSTGGCGALHAQPLRVGEQFQIPLACEAGAETLSLVCTVVRCEKMDEALYSIGFEFNSSTAAVDEASRQFTGKPARRGAPPPVPPRLPISTVH
jgi:hypothetical protein